MTSHRPVGIRLVTESVKVGGKARQPGRKLLMPYKQLHIDPHVFGTNVDEFDPRRFMNDKGLERGSSWRPFGGFRDTLSGPLSGRERGLHFSDPRSLPV